LKADAAKMCLAFGHEGVFLEFGTEVPHGQIGHNAAIVANCMEIARDCTASRRSS
jgi:hypothetical protein